ncbi:hypothetical protein IHQ56_15980, partial [Methylobacillus flagellatus]|uniref:hypothetical protein n=1 Tax=Methylobacillus flagellatus TaxID=405 RepID=UPI0028541829
MTISWPVSLKPRNSSYDLRNMAATGGRTGTGREQRVFKDPGYWVLNYTVPVREKAQAREWRAMVTRLRAGEDIVAMVCDRWRADGAPGPYTAELLADAAARATTLSIGTVGLDITAGVAFSIGNRLYRITSVNSHTPIVYEGWDDAEAWDDDLVWLDHAVLSPD